MTLLLLQSRLTRRFVSKWPTKSNGEEKEKNRRISETKQERKKKKKFVCSKEKSECGGTKENVQVRLVPADVDGEFTLVGNRRSALNSRAPSPPFPTPLSLSP